MADTLRTLVAVDTGVDVHEITNTVTSDGNVSVVGVVDGLDDAWRALQDSSCDVLVVACQGYSERALVADRRAPSSRIATGRCSCSPGLAERLRPPRLRGRRRRHPDAAADARPGAVLDPASSSRARRARPTARRAPGPADLRARPEGRLRARRSSARTSASRSPRPGAKRRDRRPRPPVRRRRPLPRARPGANLLRPRARRRNARRAEARRVPDDALRAALRVLLAPTRPDQASSITVELIRDVYASLRVRRSTSSSSTRRPGSRRR